MNVLVLGRETAEGLRQWYSHIENGAVVWVNDVKDARAFQTQWYAELAQRMLCSMYGEWTMLDAVSIA